MLLRTFTTGEEDQQDARDESQPHFALLWYSPAHAHFFFAAQRAFNAATILARPSGLSLRFFFAGLATTADFVGAFKAGAPFLRAAQRAFIAAANFARPSGVSPFFLEAGAAFTAVFAATAGLPFDLLHLAR